MNFLVGMLGGFYICIGIVVLIVKDVKETGFSIMGVSKLTWRDRVLIILLWPLLLKDVFR